MLPGAFPACGIPLIFPCCTRSLFCWGRRFAVNCERFVQPAQDCGFFYAQNSGAAVSPGRKAYFLPLTLAVAAIFFIIKTGRRLRLTAIKARVSLFLFVPPARRFFALKTAPPLPPGVIRHLKMKGCDAILRWTPGQPSGRCPGWLKKIPKPGQRGREGKQISEIRVKKNRHLLYHAVFRTALGFSRPTAGSGIRDRGGMVISSIVSNDLC